MDYNIYIHNISNGTSQTTPFQISGDGHSGETQGAFSNDKANASFINPPEDSLIGDVMKGKAFSSSLSGSLAGGVGIVVAAIAAYKALINQIDQSVTFFSSFYVADSGDSYRFNEWKNAMQVVNNMSNPIGTALNAFKTRQSIFRANAKDKQNLALYGGTIINSQYGRYI